MPLYNFIKVLVTNDLSFIGKAPLGKLEEAWEAIFSEYMSLSNDTTQNHFLSLIKEITVLNNKLNLAQVIIDEFAKEYNPAFGPLLNQLGFKYKYSKESYRKDLKLTVSNAKGHLIRLEQRKKDLESLQAGGGEAKESDYISLLAELSKFQGYHIDQKNITVSEFIAIQNSYKAANKPKNGK